MLAINNFCKIYLKFVAFRSIMEIKKVGVNMALISCPECKKDVSDKASACPNCGCPLSDIIKRGIVRVKMPNNFLQ